jgi:NAD(P)-dependent dehydrogenase (short-subunit alcohol dehydrogenase family)
LSSRAEVDTTNVRRAGELLAGRTAVISGGASRRGIGKATAELFAAHGARTAILDLDREACEEVAAEVGGGSIGIGCDIRDKGACAEAIERVVDAFGRVDVLVNNAGVGSGTPILDITPEEFDRVHAVNVRGTLFLSQAVIPVMQSRGRGRIVCLASVAGQRGGGLYGSTHYAASKAGVIGLAQGMARELASSNILVNVVSPSLIATDGSPNDSPERRAAFEKGVPLQRSGTAREVAGAVLFLASDLAGYVTGAVLDVNGGFHIH